MEILKFVRMAAAKRILLLSHAVEQMNSPERLISISDVRRIIEHGEVIENYPEDPRGQSCLILGIGENGRPIHVVCAPKADYLAVITAYVPEGARWMNSFKKRRTEI